MSWISMVSPNLRWLGGTLLAGALTTSPAIAQPIAQSFAELPGRLKPGQTVFVKEASGRATRGKIASLSESALVLLTPETRTFVEDVIREIRAVDPLVNGVLIGVGVGIGLALWDYLIDPSEPENARIFATAIGLGAAIGGGVDALVCRPGRTIFLPPQAAARVRISPVLAPDRQGVLVSVRF